MKAITFLQSLPITAILLTSSTLSFAQPQPPAVLSAPQTYRLEATPSTIAWGYYGFRNAADKPVLSIDSGDTVVFDTLLTASPKDLKEAGVSEGQVQKSLYNIYNNVKHDPNDPKIGVHILTGPVYIKNAEPGDTLEVRIQKVELAIPYAYNRFKPKEGLLPEDFPYEKMKIIPLDKKRMVATFAPNINIPLRPFFGSMGVAPSSGYIHSAPPGIHGGNIDNKELVAGTTLYLPVHVSGALFQVGDGHAGQGNGEVDLTGIETSLKGTLQFIVHKGTNQKHPRAETPTHYISMGYDPTLDEATRMAVREMIDFLVKEKHLSRDDAYMLVSTAGDVDITELVDGNKVVHVMMPKAIFTK
jgi:acetamidase/formamidase